TPVVAQACQQFSHIYRRPRGLFVSYPLRESIPALLRSRPNPDVDVMVVTGGERILGRGGQGGGGRGGRAAAPSPSATSPRTRSSAPSAGSGRCRSCWTWEPTTPNGSTTPSISAGG